ncbi:MAG: UDP-N-acetylmuramoyl-L-alanyl-D-glutamate--2,6-diaminopimelate ligase [Myxococcota bacterium]|jgi:UDP-N-acetylmuramyl-tripeptide synthetase|nr:UDP-N-acetylmuramoyl-L-alanyl-D-glutamate--2,6-diaminopimelate ligase [Myxococcota bacterium]
MELAQLQSGFGFTELRPGNAQVEELCIDLRELRPGMLFIARRAYFGDTHAQLEEAIARGASAIMVSKEVALPPQCRIPVLLAADDDPTLAKVSSRFYGYPGRQLRVFAVTGTNGKTSVACLLELLLEALGQRPALMGTLAYRFGAHSFPAVNTTPDALYVQRFARQALDWGARSLILEASSHALAIGRLECLGFDSVGFTNLSHEHLDFHGDMQRYFEAKARLFDPLLADSVAEGKAVHAAAVLSDTADELLRRAARHGRSCAVELGSERSGAPTRPTCRVETLADEGVQGRRLRFDWGAHQLELRSPLLGAHNVENLGLAMAMLVGALGESALTPAFEESVSGAMAQFAGIPGRLEQAISPAFLSRLGPSFPRAALVDYAHTPEALRRVLQVLRQEQSRLCVVLGCGGDRDPSKRSPMARAALEGSDFAVFTSDNPRTEAPLSILAEMTEGLETVDAGTWCVEAERRRGIAVGLEHAADGILLIAGKGHESYQEIEGRRYAFDDGEALRRSVAARLWFDQLDATPWVCGWSASRIAKSCGVALTQRPLLRPWRSIQVEAAACGPEDLLISATEPATEVAFCLCVEDVATALRRLAEALWLEGQRQPLAPELCRGHSACDASQLVLGAELGTPSALQLCRLSAEHQRVWAEGACWQSLEALSAKVSTQASQVPVPAQR